MLQYLLNISCIWTLGTAVYFSLLRKESFHSFNRIYLVGLVVAGIVIPFITWHTPVASPTADVSVTYTAPYTYAEQSSVLKQQVVAVVQPTSNVGIAPIVWSIYFAGVFLMLLMLAKEVFKIIRLYRGSIKTQMQGYTLIETSKLTAPFSIAGYIFISGRDHYGEQEYNLIIAHELRHIQLKHTIDLILLYVLQTIFWFHPLMYIVRKNLLLVHEYQADKIVHQSANNYGLFLIEQAMLLPAPVLSHSFAHSPLKNRIMMLTKKSARIARAKMLVVVPLALVSVLAFSNCNNTNNTLSPEHSITTSNNIAKYKGHIIDLKTRATDTTYVMDNGIEKMEIHQWAADPIMLDKKTVYTIFPAPVSLMVDEYPEILGQWSSLGEYLFNNLKDDFEEMADGKYNLPFANMVIDEKGELVYYQYSSIQQFDVPWQEAEKLGTANHLDNKVKSLMYKAPMFKPAKVDGQNVPCKFYGLWSTQSSDKTHGYVLVENRKARIVYKTS